MVNNSHPPKKKQLKFFDPHDEVTLFILANHCFDVEQRRGDRKDMGVPCLMDVQPERVKQKVELLGQVRTERS